jgi:hypothetical protein
MHKCAPEILDFLMFPVLAKKAVDTICFGTFFWLGFRSRHDPYIYYIQLRITLYIVLRANQKQRF